MACDTSTGPADVHRLPAASVVVSPTSVSLTVGGSAILTASVKAADGEVITGTTVNWFSSNPSVATVSSAGAVQAVAAGSAIVTATSRGKSGSAAVATTEVALPVVSAFPGAEGFGAMALASCRGLPVKVHKVTSLENSGTGTLRDILDNEVSSSSYDIVVFEVGGTITTSSQLDVQDACVYVAGQTALGGGVQIRNLEGNGNTVLRVLRSGVHDVAVRYLRLRAGKGSPGTGDNLVVLGGHDMIFDHLSLQFSNDENIAFTPKDIGGGEPLHNISLQNSIVADAMGDHSTGMLVAKKVGDPSMYALSIHRNLFASNSHRNPRVVGPVGSVHVINNVMYNWLSRVGRTVWDQGAPELDFIGNYMKAGPWGGVSSPLYFQHEWSAVGRDASLFFLGNVADPLQTDPGVDQKKLVVYWGGDGTRDGHELAAAAWRTSVTAVQPDAPVSVQAAPSILSTLLPDVGASMRIRCDGSWVPARDALDQAVVGDVQNGTGPKSYDEVDHPSDFGGYPTLAAGTPCTDSDNDGMPDEFELRFFGVPTAGDSPGDFDRDGYLNIEEYVNGMDPTLPTR